MPNNVGVLNSNSTMKLYGKEGELWPVKPLSANSRAFVLETVIATHVQIWRYHYHLGNVISRRNQARIIATKRAELRQLKAGGS